MAGGIVYLDIDDEITSAAARIRDVPGRRVAVVLPYGSRVATSRINFRLLSRDALINEKQLAVVAGDSATRALAASAGLPVFASVAEYELSLAGVTDEPAASPAAAPPAPPGAAPQPPPAQSAAIQPATPSGSTPAPSRRRSRTTAPTAATEPDSVPRNPPPGRPDESPTAAPPADDVTAALGVAREPEPKPGDREKGWWTESRPPAAGLGSHRPESRPGSRRPSRLPIVIVLAALGLVVLAGGVGAYVLLPTATVVVTPKTDDLVLAPVTITADPTATAPDATAQVVPADVVSIDVTAKDTFPATGKRVEETPATGTVRFSNLDFLRTNTIPGGSVVSTNAGVRFTTNATITVPRADLVGLTVFPGRRTVGVTAVEPGTAGNVEPNTIVIVPKGEDPQALKVVNPDAATGGTHEEFPRVAQKDVDAALASLTTDLDAAFAARVADPALVDPGVTVFDTTAVLGEATPTTDPSALVGTEVESFELELAATGTVVTVDPAPVSVIADQLLRAQLTTGHQLVADSIEVAVDEPIVSGQTVSFTATATGKEIAVLDPDELRTMILGKPLDDARDLLGRYGAVELTAWPDWVGSIPTIADRVEVRIEQDVQVETPSPASSGS